MGATPIQFRELALNAACALIMTYVRSVKRKVTFTIQTMCLLSTALLSPGALQGSVDRAANVSGDSEVIRGTIADFITMDTTDTILMDIMDLLITVITVTTVLMLITDLMDHMDGTAQENAGTMYPLLPLRKFKKKPPLLNKVVPLQPPLNLFSKKRKPILWNLKL
jgi:hypothetical protein